MTSHRVAHPSKARQDHNGAISRATGFRPYSTDRRDANPDLSTVDFSFKPKCLTEAQWGQMDASYREAWWTAPAMLDLGSEAEKEAAVVGDLLLYYKDELKLGYGIRWSEVILDCDRDHWCCIRSSIHQRPEVTFAIFTSGKDPHVNICAYYWETRFLVAALFVHWLNNEMTTGDNEIDLYLTAYLCAAKGNLKNNASREWIQVWKKGRGDLSLCVTKDYRCAYKLLKEQCKKQLTFMIAREKEKTTGFDGAMSSIKQFRGLDFAATFFNLDLGLFDTYGTAHRRGGHQAPGRLGTPTIRPIASEASEPSSIRGTVSTDFGQAEIVLLCEALVNIGVREDDGGEEDVD